MNTILRFSVISILLVLAMAPSASALTIVTSFTGGSAPANAAGRGDLISIVNSAARLWESAYSDSLSITLYIGWGPLGCAATHNLIQQGGVPNRETVGLITFDNSGATAFYLDPTPDRNEEYGRFTQEYQDLGGGLINVARVFTSATGDAKGRTDLFSVAMHEIGHALGMCNGNMIFARESQDKIIRIGSQFPFSGTLIPLAFNYAGVTSHFDPIQLPYGSLMAGLGGDERRIPSALDIVANAQISALGIQRLDLMEASPPAPSIARDTSGVSRVGN